MKSQIVYRIRDTSLAKQILKELMEKPYKYTVTDVKDNLVIQIPMTEAEKKVIVRQLTEE